MCIRTDWNPGELMLITNCIDFTFRNNSEPIIKKNNSIDDRMNTIALDISKENGRLVPNNPDRCSKNVYFYGGEVVFGYDVTDQQSIPFYFRDILKNDRLEYCVYNFGRRTYFSTQENILLQRHINNNKIKKEDIIIFIDGDNEIGINKLLNTEFIEKNYNALHQKYWKLYKVGIEHFINLLPITQLYEVLVKRNRNQNNISLETSKSELNLKNIANVYNNNINIRNAICEKYRLSCYNFLFFIDSKRKENFEEIKKEKNIFVLDNFEENLLRNKFNSFSPNSNKFLANEIYRIISIN